VHYNSHKIWINRTFLGGRFSKCFTDLGEGGESLRKRVAEWLRYWASAFGTFDTPVREESISAPAYSLGFKEKK
jgi:hypothetical protein